MIQVGFYEQRKTIDKMYRSFFWIVSITEKEIHYKVMYKDGEWGELCKDEIEQFKKWHLPLYPRTEQEVKLESIKKSLRVY
jgi:hypothetical protein